MNRFVFLFVLLFSMSNFAHAEIFRWIDPDTGAELNYPDSWKRILNQKPDDKLTIAAPQYNNNDDAQCRFRQREDARFSMYPTEYDNAIQNVYYSDEFWDKYLYQYDDPIITKINNEAGLGLGHASFIEVEYDTRAAEPVHKKAMVFASLYENNVYILECSAREEHYARWYPGFIQIAQSVDFKKTDHERIIGNYRNFIDDADIRVHGRKPQDLYIY